MDTIKAIMPSKGEKAEPIISEITNISATTYPFIIQNYLRLAHTMSIYNVLALMSSKFYCVVNNSARHFSFIIKKI